MLDLALKVRTYQIKKTISREGCTAIIACTGDLFDPPAALIASRELGIPFIFYAFDYYSFQGADPLPGHLPLNMSQILLRPRQR